MLETENEFGEDLVNFGVRVREAADLMQKQIVAAFTSSYGKVEDLDSRAQHPVSHARIYRPIPGSPPTQQALPIQAYMPVASLPSLHNRCTVSPFERTRFRYS